MKSSTIINFVCLLAPGTDAALNLVKPRGPSPIEYGLTRSETPRLRKRDTIGLAMGTQFEGFDYFVNFTIGTPPQNVAATFDTGSADLIVNSATSKFCTSASPSPCLQAFNINSSSTAKQVGQGFLDTYETASYEGNWYTDTVSFAGKSVSNFVFGAADTLSNGTTNTLGVSFFTPANYRGGSAPPTNESSLGQMVKAGLIPSAAYSIWMNRNSSLGGNVLLGGVDTSKFVGELQSYPVSPNPGTDIYFGLLLNITSASVGGKYPVSSSSNVTEFPAPATVDTGNPNLLLPSNLVANIYSTFGIQSLQLGAGGATFGICNCTLGNLSSTLDVYFTGLKISIPFSDLVVSPTAELYAGYNIPAQYRLPAGVCLFLVSPTRAGFGNNLGDPFLRYVYYVVDLDSKQIGLATSNPNPGKSNIMEIAAGGDNLPSVSASGSVATSTSGTPTSSGSPSGTGSGASSTTTTKSSDANNLKAVSLGVVFGFLGLFCLL
ncbi:acid protease [Hyaloscypha hepaticicola]|uniref:Acid protease n=1 Tax=Hyaloscypha hepaticicola TaxID=2082293 RepID=A0A2J6PP78_9HELO|nr:acid protease [Hyaloscypha hepaticicola]